MSIEPRRQRGVTLVELVIFIVIIGIALAGILQVMSLNTRASADPLRRKQALMLAEALLEEVQSAKFTFCDPDAHNADTAASSADCAIAEAFGQGTGGEPVKPRPFDNVNDYVAAAATAVQAFDLGGVLSDANGNPLNLPGYTVALTVAPEQLGDIAAASGVNPADVDVLRITVAVSYDDQTLVLDGYRTRYAPGSP